MSFCFRCHLGSIQKQKMQNQSSQQQRTPETGAGGVQGSSGEFPTKDQSQMSQDPQAKQSQQQQTKPEAPTTQRKGRRQRMDPESVSVIICGWPEQPATNVAKACKERGYQIAPFGICMDECKQTQMDIPDLGSMQLVHFSDADAKQKLTEAINNIRHDERFIVLVDTSPQAAEHVQMYNELKVPFVLQSKGGEAHNRAVRDTEAAQATALITETMNKRLSVMDEMWQEWSRRYPGLFGDFDFSFKSTRPQETSRSLLNSFSDMINRDLGVDTVQPFSETESKGFTEGSVTREYTFKDGSGSSSFSFRQSVNDEKDYAESIADSVGFLAQKTREISRPQIYNILDVAQQQRLLSW
jgi:hypothetical protein